MSSQTLENVASHQAHVYKSDRLYSLDALRGFDMFWIMGAATLIWEWQKIHPDNTLLTFLRDQTAHAEWHGFTFFDLIFPLFLFISGVAAPYSLGKKLEKGVAKNKLLVTVIKRSLLLVLLGIVYNNGLAIKPIEEYRFASVLGRIGIGYMFACIIYLYANKTYQIIWCAGILIAYWLLLKFTSAPGYAAGDLTMEGNFASYMDKTFMPGYLYLGVHDPEGFFSSIPAISTGLFGILTGDYLKNNIKDPKPQKALLMLIAGILLILIAQIWNLDFPVNKNLWSSSFACQAAGISLLFFSLFYYIIDVMGFQKWAFFFKVIGMNSIFIYMSGIIINWDHATRGLFGWFISIFKEPTSFVIGAACIILVKWLALYYMYKKKIFIKV